MIYSLCSTCSGKGEKGMLSTKKWDLVFKIFCYISKGILISLVCVGCNILDLLYLCIIIAVIFEYVVDKKLK